METRTRTVYNQVVIPLRSNREYNPSRATRPSNNPVLRESFSSQNSTRTNERNLNYPEVQIGTAPNGLTQVYQPNVADPKPELIQSKPELIQSKPELIQSKPELIQSKPELIQSIPEPGEELASDVTARKCRTLDYRKRSSVRNITRQFEDRTALKCKSYTLSRGAGTRGARRTSVREMAQLYDTMAEDNRRDQQTQNTPSLSRSTSFFCKRAVMRTATDYINLTPVCSGPASARNSPQLYMNVSPQVLKPSSSCYENWTPSEASASPMDPYEEVFPGRYKSPETGELMKCMDWTAPVPANQKPGQSAAESRVPTFQKPRSETIATIGTEECEKALGRFSLVFHPTEPDLNSANQKTGSAATLTLVVYKTRISFSDVNTNKLPSNVLFMDLLTFQLDPSDTQVLNLVVRSANEFQTHKFSSPSNELDDVITCLKGAVTEEKTSTLHPSDTEEYFALLLGCAVVSSATGQVTQGVEQVLTSQQLSQSIQVRLDVRDGMQLFPFGRSQTICVYKKDQIKGVAVWEHDPRVLGIVTQNKTGKFLCYALRFNRTNQLQVAFSSIRHFCTGEVAEEKKKNAWYSNLISKRKVKSQTNSESGSRPSTPTLDQMDPDTFMLLYLGTTQPEYRTFTPECIQQEHSNLMSGRNVSELVSPPATTLLNVSDKSLRITDKDKVHFLKRVYQKGMVVTCVATGGPDNLLGLVTERKGTNELRCSVFRPLFSEAKQVAAHVTSKLRLSENSF